MTDPPFDVGSEKAMLKVLLPAVMEFKVGDEEAPEGVTDDASELVPSPIALTARTMTEYCVPLERPEIVNELARVPVLVQFPFPNLYSYFVISRPPFAGTSNVTVALVSYPTKEVNVGAEGIVVVIPVATAEAKPAPAVLTARNSTK